MRLFPSFVCVADELALELEEKLERIGSEVIQELMTEQQWEAFQALDQQLFAMSGPTGLWTDEALEFAIEWQAVRSLAAGLINLMGWSTDSPPPTSAIYVGPES